MERSTMVAEKSLPRAQLIVEGKVSSSIITAQIVRFIIPEPTGAEYRDDESYLLNMCLTPRPNNARGCYRGRWGAHRFERLGDIVLMLPGEDLVLRGDSGQQGTLICSIKRDTLHGIIGHVLDWDDSRIPQTLDIQSARLRALLFRLTEEVRFPGFASEQMLDFMGGQIAIELARVCMVAEDYSDSGGLAGWRLRLIDERLAAHNAAPSLKELADLCKVSVRQLTRGFRKSRGSTLGEYIERYRMENAKRMLMTGESVKNTAYHLGYASASSFTFAFKRAIGVSPSQFRDRQARAFWGAEAR